jgi:hypothetical protein
VSVFYNSNFSKTSTNPLNSNKELRFSSTLLEGFEFDHLRLFNSNFLISLTTTKSSNSLTVHNLALVKQELGTVSTPLKFRI